MAESRPRKRRRDGSGSLYRLQDGRWRGMVTRWLVERDGTRRRDRRTFYAASEEEGQAELDRLKAELHGDRSGSKTPRRRGRPSIVRLAEYLRQWHAGREGEVRPKTYWKADWALTHLLPALGDLQLSPVCELTQADLRVFFAQKRKEGLSPASLRILRMTLAAALQQAKDEDHLIDRNPAREVKTPAIPKPTTRPLAPAEVRRFLAAARAEGDRFLALWTVALYHGCRPGELLGLVWNDFDEAAGDHGVLRVWRKLEAIGEGHTPILTEPKTAAGVRTLYLVPETAAVLRELRQRQRLERIRYADVYADHGLIFCSRWGTPLLASNVIRAFKLALGRAGLPQDVRLYDTRHTTGTNLAAAGVDAATIAYILGHKDAGFTYRTYVKPFDAQQREAWRRLRRAFGEDGATGATDAAGDAQADG